MIDCKYYYVPKILVYNHANIESKVFILFGNSKLKKLKISRPIRDKFSSR